MKRKKQQFKKGAASFYIVAFSTLILLIVATSFAAIIISELNRTMNEDLSQSAYDSAMAGVEDAKLAYYSYQNCVENENNRKDCKEIKSIIEQPANWDCNMVANILGRSEGGVMIQESSTNNNMQQEYTCVKIQTVLKDYRSSLSSSNQMKVIKTNFDDNGGAEGSVANAVERIKISWYDDTTWKRAYNNFTGNAVKFYDTITKALSVPPTISVAVLQTAENFNMSDFDMTVGNKTNRGMVYLVPSNQVRGGGSTYRKSNWDATNNTNNIGSEALRYSNDKTVTNLNLPYAVYCSPDGEFACSATITLPRPIADASNGADVRNPDTFIVVVSLPYGGPTTNFAVEFLCKSGSVCHTERDGTGNATESSSTAYLDGVQVKVDSTGRANDLYRRVETRLQSSSDSSYLSIMGPLELLGENKSGAYLMNKSDTVKCEYNFGRTC